MKRLHKCRLCGMTFKTMTMLNRHGALGHMTLLTIEDVERDLRWVRRVNRELTRLLNNYQKRATR